MQMSSQITLDAIINTEISIEWPRKQQAAFKSLEYHQGSKNDRKVDFSSMKSICNEIEELHLSIS
jgi:hypothetical protein